MKFPDYKHEDIEPQIQDFWQKKKIVEKLRKKNEKGKKFNFLQGPPYTSGRVHLGTAWNTVLKDMALRYKRSQGFNVWDRNGYDVHGLPTEHKVTAKYNLKTKEDIEAFGIDKFVQECIKTSLELADFMTTDFSRMGCTLNYSDSYMALKEDYMDGEWWLVKQAWKKNRLYLGEKVMTWCGDCETALAKHECEYQNVTEKSIFLKFKLKGKKSEYLVIWTTTPWTIPYNLGVMVNPELDYVKVKVDDELWILGKSLAGPFVQSLLNKNLKVVEEFKGEELLGIEYEHPFADKIPQYKELKKQHPRVHTIVLSSEHVDFTAGTGLVHMAPGCGPEDYEVGREYDIPPFNTLNQHGELTEMPSFKGRKAKKDDQKFIDDLEKAGALVTTSDVEHDYPHCWRCHHGVVFRTTKQWFFKIEDLRDKMVKANQKVNWIPKTQAFDSWTAHLKDNSITRQRFWGTPVPIWKCSNEDCEEVEVLGSKKELEEKAGKNNVPKDIHRPWIDEVKWNCKKCKGKMTRIPDILDVWIDAGTASWNCLYYPQEEEFLKQYYPADLILEATEQVRLWFSMLSICSQLGFDSNCYKNVYMHGMLNDIDGKKMSKSLGNIISPYELIDKHGADGLRYYMCQTNAGKDVNFSWDECKTKARNLHILWNIHKLLINLARENKVNPFKLDAEIIHNVMGVEEHYIISKLHSTVNEVGKLFDAYRLDETIAPLEDLYLELSRTYVQMVRDKSALGEDQDKEVVMYTIGHVLLETMKMFSIVAPFISEAMYLNLKEEFGLKEESITHYQFPSFEGKQINPQLEKQMDVAKSVIQGALAAREKAKIGLRWPVKEVVVVSSNEEVLSAVEELRDIIKKQTNAKSITVLSKLPGVVAKVKSDFGKIGQAYGELSPQIITRLTVDSPETILGHIEKEGFYKFNVEGKEVRIIKDMLNVERDVPAPFVESELRNGLVYVNTERSEELEAEGYAREIMRHVQALRKKAGFQKLDEIILFLKTSAEMKPRLEKFRLDIEEKVGAEKMEISNLNPVKKHEHNSSFKVKEEEFEVWFNKI
ncbi:MAG: isoleucine--tRNA ligase [Nanoarchaeota archaeon]|nr:isoleucine--tRNA ligase [Nanoarchaeota archaeon]MBU1643860.1 isoleucine--tRNA ligase [Nanoarchaeota archaeon]MBU1977452.1 isoleucine--tRNA ligase [Nanoarchaeota archaeon]